MDNNNSQKRGRKFNIVLTCVALILVLAVGGMATYSWIEQSTDMNLHMNEGNIKDAPENYEAYYQNVKVGPSEGDESFVSLNQFADLADGFTFTQLSSSNGEDFFYQKPGGGYKALDVNDKSVSYISMDMDIESTTTSTTYFFFDSELIKFIYGDNDSNDAKTLKMAIKVTPAGGTSTTTIFSKEGASYSAVTSTSGATTTVTTKAFSEYVSQAKNIFTLGNKGKAKVKIAIWLEGTENADNTLIANNEQIKVNFQINTNWYKSTNRYIYVYDGTVGQVLSDSTSATYTAYDASNNVIGTANTSLYEVYENNKLITKTAIISDMANVSRVEFNFTKPGTTLSHTYTWDDSSRTETEVYYTITDYTKDSE